MSIRKVIGGSFGAIIILIIAQILSQIIGSLFLLINVMEWICNIFAGVFYLILTYIFLNFFAIKILKIDMKILGIPKFHIKKKWIVVALLLPLVVIGIYLLLPGKFVNTGMDNKQIFATLSSGIIYTGIAAGFVEEMVFRGFILNLLDHKWGKRIASFIPSILFGVVHIIGMNYLVVSCGLVILAGTMVGIMFSLIEIESNSVWNSGIVHVLWNVLIIGGGLTISESLDNYSIFTYVLETKKFIFTGGDFGIESSVIAIVGYALIILFTLFYNKDILNKVN